MTQAVQFPDPAPGTSVQGHHEIPGDGVIADPGRGDPVSSVDVLQGLGVPVAPGLRVCPGQIQVDPGAAIRRAERGQGRRRSIERLSGSGSADQLDGNG